MSAIGAFTFVLHSHLPYARLAGRWPHGEEWIHEAATETYIPLLKMLFDLKEEGVNFRLTLGITPTLAEQLSDPLVLENLNLYLDAKIEAAQRDIKHFENEEKDADHLQNLARWYITMFTDVKDTLNNRFGGDIIGRFRQLQEEGYLEIFASAATHAYLPLLAQDSTINGQIKAGIHSYKRIFGREPRSFWLPECGYRPAVMNGTLGRPGLERFLMENGIELFFSETHTITGGKPVGVATGDVIGPPGAVKRRYVIPKEAATPQRLATTHLPYYVSDSSAGRGAREHSGVAVIGRNNNSGQQVWSADWGYPGDFDYREFYKKAGTSGLQYWRVTGDDVQLDRKDVYHPDWARYKVDQHAEHFAHLVGDLLREFHKETGEYGIVSSNYDTELFGHWWFEGVEWLGKVLRHMADHPEIELTTASDYVEAHPPQAVLSLPEGSWGAGGTHFTWDNAETHWMWTPIGEAERRMEVLVANFQEPTPDEEFVLNHVARELLLLQSSDWQSLITTGQAKEYAIQRFTQHLDRFNQLADSMDAIEPNITLAKELWEKDNVFPDIDYRWFTAR
ncbi:MAG: 1,4-alpha-glucan branching protein domain-containing protein [Chloroflexota bacterium]